MDGVRGPAGTGAFLSAEDGALVSTDAGPTFVRTVGQGAPVLVLHGGPGFDHRYLRGPLASLATRRRLVFYDQPGCGLTPAPAGGVTLGATFAQCRAMLRMLAAEAAGTGSNNDGGREQGIGVIAHSWGALVLIAAYATGPAAGEGDRGALPVLAEGLLINPVAIARREWDVAFGRLLSRASPERIARFGERLAAGDGEGAMEAALPIYTRRGYAAAATPFPLNAATYLGLSGALGDFDYSAGASALAHLTVINGSDDFTGPELIQPIIANAAATARPSVGHFPFFEAPAEFAALVAAAFP
jgi:pimeloyl-ACP methyl ester carboxylesterase